METIKDMLDDPLLAFDTQDKYEVLLAFVSAYGPWAILFKEFLESYEKANTPPN